MIDQRIKITSVFEFERHLDKELKKLNLDEKNVLYDLIVDVCVESFKIGMKAKEHPENRPVNLG